MPHKEIRLTDTTEGVYQIEVRGRTRSSYYRLVLLPTADSETRTDVAMRPLEEGDEQPIIPPNSAPGRHVGIPSAPVVAHRIFLPVVLRHSTP